MVKSVSGYLTVSGQYFEDENSAIHAENLETLSNDFAKSIQYSGSNFFLFIDFIQQNLESVTNYCHSLKQIEVTTKKAQQDDTDNPQSANVEEEIETVSNQ